MGGTKTAAQDGAGGRGGGGGYSILLRLHPLPFEKVPINGKFMVKKQLERQNIFTKRAGDRGR